MFNIYVQNIDCGYTFEPPQAVVTSTHNLYFGANITKIVYFCIPHFYCTKVIEKGVEVGNDQEMVQSDRNSRHSKTEVGKN